MLTLSLTQNLTDHIQTQCVLYAHNTPITGTCLRGRLAQLHHAERSEPRQWGVNNLLKVAAHQHRYWD